MTEPLQLFVYAYDIGNDRRRARVAALLEEEAARVQHSVFETVLPRSVGVHLATQVERLLTPGDRLRVYMLSASRPEQIICYGGAPVQSGQDYWLL